MSNVRVRPLAVQCRVHNVDILFKLATSPNPNLFGHWLYVRFPDIPEILTGGGTIEEAIQNAKEAFACHIEALQKQGKKIPEPKGKLMYA